MKFDIKISHYNDMTAEPNSNSRSISVQHIHTGHLVHNGFFSHQHMQPVIIYKSMAQAAQNKVKQHNKSCVVELSC